MSRDSNRPCTTFAESWPAGPDGESSFQPILGNRMKTRTELANNQAAQRRNAESRRAKRARVQQVAGGNANMELDDVEETVDE